MRPRVLPVRRGLLPERLRAGLLANGHRPVLTIFADLGTTCPRCGHVERGDADEPRITIRPHGGMRVAGVDVRLPFAAFLSLFEPEEATFFANEIAADLAFEHATGQRPAARPDLYVCPCRHKWPRAEAVDREVG